MKEGCKCDWCGRIYRVDLLLPDPLWKEIAIDNIMLCGVCIMLRIEDKCNILNEYDYFHLRKE